jgi:hypothetical protein
MISNLRGTTESHSLLGSIEVHLAKWCTTWFPDLPTQVISTFLLLCRSSPPLMCRSSPIYSRVASFLNGLHNHLSIHLNNNKPILKLLTALYRNFESSSFRFNCRSSTNHMCHSSEAASLCRPHNQPYLIIGLNMFFSTFTRPFKINIYLN